PGQGQHLGEWAARQPAAQGVRLIAVLDDECDPRDFEDCMWTLLNNMDPERDAQIISDPAGVGPLFAIDATPKLRSEGFDRDWPEKLTMPSAVKARVDELWPEISGRGV
ncbi:MAG TPA: UbiD family decarboxylase, partial [Trueperaceae bacterium]|nr:UbiD family decarboxylase [Trueperaceae bacterium]